MNYSVVNNVVIGNYSVFLDFELVYLESLNGFAFKVSDFFPNIDNDSYIIDLVIKELSKELKYDVVNFAGYILRVKISKELATEQEKERVADIVFSVIDKVIKSFK